jgi:hypothetical protein
MEELKMAKYTIAKAKKLTTLGKVEWGVSMQSCNNPEQVTVHVQHVITVIKQGEDCWDQEGMRKKQKESRMSLTRSLCGTVHKSFG